MTEVAQPESGEDSGTESRRTPVATALAAEYLKKALPLIESKSIARETAALLSHYNKRVFWGFGFGVAVATLELLRLASRFGDWQAALALPPLAIYVYRLTLFLKWTGRLRSSASQDLVRLRHRSTLPSTDGRATLVGVIETDTGQPPLRTVIVQKAWMRDLAFEVHRLHEATGFRLRLDDGNVVHVSPPPEPRLACALKILHRADGIGETGDVTLQLAEVGDGQRVAITGQLIGTGHDPSPSTYRQGTRVQLLSCDDFRVTAMSAHDGVLWRWIATGLMVAAGSLPIALSVARLLGQVGESPFIYGMLSSSCLLFATWIWHGPRRFWFDERYVDAKPVNRDSLIEDEEEGSGTT